MDEKNYIRRSDPGSIADLLSAPLDQDQITALALHGNPAYYAAAYPFPEVESVTTESGSAAIVLTDLEAEPSSLAADVSISSDTDFAIVRDSDPAIAMDDSADSPTAHLTGDDSAQDSETVVSAISLDAPSSDEQNRGDINLESLTIGESKPSTTELEAELDDFVLWLKSLGTTPAPAGYDGTGRRDIHQDQVHVDASSIALESAEESVDSTPDINVTKDSKEIARTATIEREPSTKQSVSSDSTSKIAIDRDRPASEALANLLAEQGHVEEAIEMYQELSLRNPEKKTTFAQLIEKLSS